MLVGVRGARLFKFHAREADAFAADGFEFLEDVVEAPAAVLSFAVAFEKGLEAPGHVPLQVVGEHADEDVAAQAFVEAVIHRADLELNGFEIAEGLLDLEEAFVGRGGSAR